MNIPFLAMFYSSSTVCVHTYTYIMMHIQYRDIYMQIYPKYIYKGLALSSIQYYPCCCMFH